MPSLIGNKPNQVPSNGDLGTLAFQDANAVKITGGDISGNIASTGLNFDSNTLVIDATNNRVGIGTASPTTALSIYSSTVAPAIRTTGDGVGTSFSAQRYTTDATGTFFQFEKFRGSLASPLAVSTGDNSGTIQFRAYGGTNVRTISNISGIVEAYTSDTDISGYLTFGTSPSGSAAPTERMRITSAGNVGIGTSSPRNAGAGYSVLALDGTNSGVLDINANANRVLTVYGSTNDALFVNPTATGNIRLYTNSTERMRIDSAGKLLLGTTSALSSTTGVSPTLQNASAVNSAGGILIQNAFNNNGAPGIYSSKTRSGTIGDYSTAVINGDFLMFIDGEGSDGVSALKRGGSISINAAETFSPTSSAGYIAFNTTASGSTSATERMRITSDANLLFGKTNTNADTAGFIATTTYLGGYIFVTNTDAAGANYALGINRQSSDGTLIAFRQANTQEGYISVSGTTVSYNGGHLSRVAQTTSPKDNSILKGTVLSNLDEMNTYVDADGNPVENEQLNKVKVSDTEGDVNVAGVFVNWYFDEQHNVDEINMAMTGDMIIRIAEGVTVQRGDLLMSAGDGTAKPQGDDIVRSKTIAKVTSTNVTCTYTDGSYCVPCVLMAC